MFVWAKVNERVYGGYPLRIHHLSGCWRSPRRREEQAGGGEGAHEHLLRPGYGL